MLERKTEKTLNCICTNNGGEYIGLFKEYCKSHDIKHDQTVPKTPQHNDVVERKNRTIVEKNQVYAFIKKILKIFLRGSNEYDNLLD